MTRARGKVRLVRKILVGFAGLLVLALAGMIIAIRIEFNTEGD